MTRPLGRALCSMGMLVALAGCPGPNDANTAAPTTGQDDATVPAPVAAPDDAALVAALGDGGAAIVMVRDQGWSSLASMLQGLEGPMDGLPNDAFLRAPTVLAAVQELPGFDVLKLPPAPEIPGRDSARPIVASLGEALTRGPAGTTVLRFAGGSGRLMPDRTQLAIPSTDLAVSVDAVHAWLLGADGAEDGPSLVEGRAGARGVSFRSGQWAAVLPEVDRVRVVVFDGVFGRPSAALKPLLDVQPAELPTTPALATTLDPSRPVSILLRPWRIRAFGTWLGLYQTERAVEVVSPSLVNAMRLRGTGTATVAERLMPRGDEEFDDWAFGLKAVDDDVHATVVASLTPQGRRMWAGAAGNLVQPLPMREGVTASVRLSLDLGAMLEHAGRRALPQSSPGAIAEAIRECGPWCLAYGALRAPIASLRAPGLADDFWLNAPKHPFTVQYGAKASGAMRSDETMAFIGARGIDDVAALAMLWFGRRVNPQRVERGDNGVLLLGPPEGEAAFDVAEGPEPAAGVLLDVHAEPGAVHPLLGLDAILSVSDTALVVDAVVGDGEATKTTAAPSQWSSPLLEPDVGDAACLAALAEAVVSLGEVPSVVAEQRAAYATKWIGAMDQATQCIAKTPALAGDAAAVASSLRVSVGGALVAELMLDEARDVLGPPCANEGDSAACAMRKALGESRLPPLAKHDVPDACGGYDLGIPVILEGDTLLVLDQRVPATAKGLTDALVDRLSPPQRARRDAPQVALVVPPDTPFATMRPLLDGLAAMGAAWGPVVQREYDRKALLVPMEDWSPTTTVDWTTSAKGASRPRPSQLPDPLSVTVRRGDAQVQLAGGKRRTVRSGKDIAKAVNAQKRRAALSFADDVPWSRVVSVLAGTCGSPRTLAN
ncbi:MAG: hypothetical protein AAGA54_13230 [Myxococcota bacterium]